MKNVILILPVLTLLTAVSLAGCANTIGALEGEKYNTSRNYAASFDRTWEAVVHVMQGYPVNKIDKASGLIITDWIDGTSDVYYVKEMGQRKMLKDRTRFNIKVSALSNGGSRVTVNQDVKINAPITDVHAPGGPTATYEWQDVSDIKDLPTVTSSKREQEILDAVESKLKQRFISP